MPMDAIAMGKWLVAILLLFFSSLCVVCMSWEIGGEYVMMAKTIEYSFVDVFFIGVTGGD